MVESRVSGWRIRERETRLHRDRLRHFLCGRLIEADKPLRGGELALARGWIVDFLCSQDWDEIAINRASLNKCGYIGCGRTIFGHERSLSHLAITMERRDIEADVFDSLCRASCLEAFLAVRATTTSEPSFYRVPPRSLVDAYLADGGPMPHLHATSLADECLVEEVDTCWDSARASRLTDSSGDGWISCSSSKRSDDIDLESSPRNHRLDSSSSFKSADSHPIEESLSAAESTIIPPPSSPLSNSRQQVDSEAAQFFSYASSPCDGARGGMTSGLSLYGSGSTTTSTTNEARPPGGSGSTPIGSNAYRRSDSCSTAALESSRGLRSILTTSSARPRNKKSITFGPDTKPGDEEDYIFLDEDQLADDDDDLIEPDDISFTLNNPWQSVMSWMVSWTTLNTTAFLLAERDDEIPPQAPSSGGNEASTTADSDDDFYDPLLAGDLTMDQVPRQVLWRQALLTHISAIPLPPSLTPLTADLRHLVQTLCLNNTATTIQASERPYLLALFLLLLCSNEWASLTKQQKERREATVRHRWQLVEEEDLWQFIRSLLGGAEIDQTLERWRFVSDVVFDP